MNTKSATIIVLLCCASMLYAAAEVYHVNGVNIPIHAVKITEKVTLTPSEDSAKPERKVSEYLFDTSWGAFKVLYSRYLNNSEQWKGKHGACTNSDSGIGIPGYAWNWYRGNTLRIKIDGKDIIAAQAADKVNWQDGGKVGRWCGLWKTDKADVFIRIAVVDGVDAALVEVEVDGKAKSVELVLTCYPGGFGPSYGIPSLRSVEVIKGQTVEVGTGQDARQLQIPAGASDVFYCDRFYENSGVYSKGACGLYFLPKTIASGNVTVSSYSVRTNLHLRKGERTARFALTGYSDIPNKRARRQFFESRSETKKLLGMTKFDMEAKQ